MADRRSTRRGDPGTPDPLRHLDDDLAALRAASRLRERPPPRDERPPGVLQLGSNDYLGYAQSGRVRSCLGRALETAWTGAGASRLVCGEHAAHRALERALAGWLGADAALVFTSGYAANVGTLSALAGPGDLVVSDALNHASIIDGCRLSRAELAVVPHLDLAAVRRALAAGRAARRRWVVTESYFSMDGDSPDLAGLRAACDEHDAALVVDEAHALGAVGPSGRGLAAAAGIQPDVLVGTLGKSLGAQGAFVAGSEPLVAWLWNRARSFVFSTGLSPVLAELGRAAVALAAEDDEARASLAQAAASLRGALAARGVPVLPGSTGAILPVVLGTSERAVAASRWLAANGVEVQAIRPPTVPAGTARLRVTASALLGAADVARAADALARACRELP